MSERAAWMVLSFFASLGFYALLFLIIQWLVKCVRRRNRVRAEKRGVL